VSMSTDAGMRPMLKPAQSQLSAGVASLAEKPERGPNYCDVCCFEFSSAEVYLLPHEYCTNADILIWIVLTNHQLN